VIFFGKIRGILLRKEGKTKMGYAHVNNITSQVIICEISEQICEKCKEIKGKL